MSDAQQTEHLVGRLVEDGNRCRRIPRLRVTLGLLGAVAIGVVALYLRYGVGLRPDLGGRLSGDFRFAAIWIGLVVVALGASLWVVAEGIPGRAVAARAGRWIASGGALLGFVLAPLLILLHVGGDGLHANSHDFVCMQGSLRLAVLPALALIAWVLWSAPAQPGRTALCAAAGAGALGATMIHATCPDVDAAHWLIGHAMAPFAAALLAAMPAWGLAHWHSARRRRPL